MAKPKVNKADYSFCEKCDVVVAKSKLKTQDELFGDGSSQPLCPFCESPVKDLE